MNIKNLSLSDLTTIKSMLETRLKIKEQWMNSQRGYDYGEYSRRELIYHKDENHEKLKRVNQQIENILNSI
jgi:hypothetical protein